MSLQPGSILLGLIGWFRRLPRLKNDGCTILMSLHGESEISAIASRAIRLEAGSVAGDTLAGDALVSIFSVWEWVMVIFPVLRSGGGRLEGRRYKSEPKSTVRSDCATK